MLVHASSLIWLLGRRWQELQAFLMWRFKEMCVLAIKPCLSFHRSAGVPHWALRYGRSMFSTLFKTAFKFAFEHGFEFVRRDKAAGQRQMVTGERSCRLAQRDRRPTACASLLETAAHSSSPSKPQSTLSCS